MYTLYGTVTSPYVRRVRALAVELGVALHRVDTADDDGQGQLREVNPLWRIPTLTSDDQALFDSTVICRYLLRRYGPGKLTPWDPADSETQNLVTVIDGALDSLINVFYLHKDGVSGEQASYLAKQRARAASAMSWVEQRLPASWSDAGTFGLGPLALYSCLDWMRFRDTYDLSPHPQLLAFLQAHAQRPSLTHTAPPRG